MTRTPAQLAVSYALVGFILFYSAQKYLAAAPAGFVPAYVTSVVILVALTALLPLVISWIATRLFQSKSLRITAALVLPLVLSAAGFTLYWAVYLNPAFSVPLGAVLPRAVFPGVGLGILLAATVSLRSAPRASGTEQPA